MTLRRNDSELNHYEHQALRMELTALVRALDGMICDSEVYANLGTVGQVFRCGRDLYRRMPTHFANEEQMVLEEVAALGPDWAAFASEMRRQHLQLQAKLEELVGAMQGLQDAPDLAGAIDDVKRRGRELARDLNIHMGVEERRLKGIQTHS